MGTPMNSKKDTKSAVQATKVVVFGLDDDTKPRAGRFSEKDAEAAVKAATQLGMSVWRVTTPSLPDSVSKIPAGTVTASGWNILPKISRDLFESVLKYATLDNPKRNSTVPIISDQDKASVKGLKPADLSELERQIIAVAHERQTGRLPESWSAIKEGSVVLVHQNRDDGWWEGYVLKRQGNMVTLRWRDFPKQDSFVRHVACLALMDPGTKQ
jgi:hypothetical protein